MMSNKIEKEEFIEILDHGYVVRKGSRKIYCCNQSRKGGRCARSECRRKQMRNSFRTKRLRGKIKSKKMRKKKKEKETGKEKSPEFEVSSIPETEPPHLLPGPEPQSPSQQSALLNDSSTNMGSLIEGEPASFTEPAIGAVDRPRLPTPETEIDTETGTMVVERKLLWNINSAYHCRGVLGEEDVGDFPDVRLEPEPTNLSDPNAIKLMFRAIDGEWVHGGYVPKVETQKVRDLEAKGSIISARVAFWRNRGDWRAPYVQLLYRERIKRVALTNQTLLTPSIVTDRYWVSIDSRKYKPRRVYGKWLLFVDKKQLDSVWHRVSYNVENGKFGRGCTAAKCSTARENPHCTDSSEGVIVVYTTRSTINHVGFKLSKLTRIPRILYKTEAATLAGIYTGDPGCTIKKITYNNGIPRLSNTKDKN